MLGRAQVNDYRPVTRSRHQRESPKPAEFQDDRGDTVRGIDSAKINESNMVASITHSSSDLSRLKTGHFFSYTALFLFTAILYARPGEFYPSTFTASIALIVALAALAFYVPAQLTLEGNLTARPGEVNLVLLYCFAGLLSIPFAINRSEAWHEFSGTFIRCIVMFVVLVNVVRTKTRLRGLLFLALVSSVWLSMSAINEYRQGLLGPDGYRVTGSGSGIFGNTNDMALHVVTILPITIALLIGSRGMIRRGLYAVCAAIMVAAIVLSYSRGAFIAMIIVLIFIAFKIGPRHRTGIILAIAALAGAIVVFAPDKYGVRLLSIFFPSLDPGGSADFRRGELFRSLYIALRHPVLGIGMGNYQPEMSYRGLVTHNSYTQVACEMGVAALACYTMFIVSPLRKLRKIASETFEARANSHFYYLAVGLEASLIAYMVASFFLSVAYTWYVFYLVGFAVCLRRLYEAETGKAVVLEPRAANLNRDARAIITEQVTT